MSTQLLEIPIVKELDYIENGEDQIRIPRQNHIRRLNFDFTAVLKSGAAAPDTAKNLGWIAALKRIKLEAGTTTLFSWSAPFKRYLDIVELGTEPVMSALSTPAANASGSEMHFRFAHDFALERRSLRSLGEVLNPAQFADLKLSVEWGDAGDVYTNKADGEFDDKKTKCRVSMVVAYDDDKEGANLIPSKPPLIREVQRNRVDIDRKYSDLDGDSLEVNIVPTGNTILRRYLFAQSNVASTNPALADDIIVNAQYQDIRGGRELYLRDSWNRLKAQMKTDFGLQKGYTGVLAEDWLDFRAGGLFVPSSEALKAYYTTNAPENNETDGLTVLERFI